MLDLKPAAQAALIVADSFDDLDLLMPVLQLDDYSAFEDDDTCAVYGEGRDANYLIFRGTFNTAGWITDLDFKPTNHGAFPGKIHEGFGKAWDQFNVWFNKRYESDKQLYIIGHSLGGALATLATYIYPATKTFTFGQPSVGDSVFADYFGKHPFERYVNGTDPVPHIAPFRHVCEETHIGRTYLMAAFGALFGVQAALKLALSEHLMGSYANEIAG